MILSTISKGSLVTGDRCVVEVSGVAPPERILWIPARVRYQARLTRSSIAVTAIIVKRNDEKSVVFLPDNEEVGVFVGDIVFSFQEVRPPWGILLHRSAQSGFGVFGPFETGGPPSRILNPIALNSCRLMSPLVVTPRMVLPYVSPCSPWGC